VGLFLWLVSDSAAYCKYSKTEQFIVLTELLFCSL